MALRGKQWSRETPKTARCACKRGGTSTRTAHTLSPQTTRAIQPRYTDEGEKTRENIPPGILLGHGDEARRGGQGDAQSKKRWEEDQNETEGHKGDAQLIDMPHDRA